MVIKDFIIEWWIQAVFGIILTGLTVAVKNIVRENKKRDQENKKEQEAIKMGIKTILYYNICKEAADIKNRGKIKREEIRDLEYLFKSYSNLGGNGVAKKLYEECMELPVEIYY
ncbi:hypothetical protein SAMN05216454_1147 [Peptostreptococcus russellii]|uniref:Uncharacterized protein n=1 Tax=Peptostreptococcus russellii TaxID=215200 RepID=A0A1H8JGA9_9FIRM|nr:hypothetical protein [Peptostreptococcus russellii]SEN79789.1 hypothetical protein SAMN05216454_1147 [Peptostreptococcus russellii]